LLFVRVLERRRERPRVVRRNEVADEKVLVAQRRIGSARGLDHRSVGAPVRRPLIDRHFDQLWAAVGPSDPATEDDFDRRACGDAALGGVGARIRGRVGSPSVGARPGCSSVGPRVARSAVQNRRVGRGVG
jgi:hypothetical protein